MLTKNDLNRVKFLLTPLDKDVRDIKKDVRDIKKDVRDIKTRVRKTEKTVDVMIDHFDREIIRTQKRVDKIEGHLNL